MSASLPPTSQGDEEAEALLRPHAFHWNLPAPLHFDDETKVPDVTQFAHQKARQLFKNVMKIQITPQLFECDDSEEENDDDEMILEEEADDDEGDDDENPHSLPCPHKETLASLTKKCTRLLSQFSTMDHLKHGGIHQTELCQMILHLLRLITCTRDVPTGTGTGITQQQQQQLYWENVGYMYRTVQDDRDNENDDASLATNSKELQDALQRPFALPSPAREALLSILISILSNKGPLRAVSNASVYCDSSFTLNTTSDDDINTNNSSNNNKQQRFLLILHWRVLLRMLLRTAPYLDEHCTAKIAVDSSSRQSAVIKRTVQLIRDARHFFDQGIRPDRDTNSNNNRGGGGGSSAGGGDDQNNNLDKTARQVWDMVQTDALFHSHTHACYRATILLYLFQPSRCSAEYYQQVLPLWWEAWSNIDRCPEFDFLWLALFCRARKYTSQQPDTTTTSSSSSSSSASSFFDWTPVRKRLLTNSQYWLQLPIGGAAMDKSFPRAGNPRSRSCPPRLKVFVGASSSYEEGIDFVAKVAKLLVAGLGTSSKTNNDDGMDVDDTTTTTTTSTTTLSEGTNDVLRFLSFATPYFNPSNLGSWTFTLGAFLHYFAYELCCRVGAAAGLQALHESHPAAAQAYAKVQSGPAARPIPPHEIVAILHALLPLCQQALYSKNGHVGRAGEAAMLYLVQMDPVHTTPGFMEFAIRALDIQAVNLSHQAPSALSALTRLVQPALRSDNVWLMRLPEMLRLSLAGVDSNDQNKTLRTLIFYRSLTSWVPVGGSEDEWPTLQLNSTANEEEDQEMISDDGTMRLGPGLFANLERARNCQEYKDAIAALPESSLLRTRSENDDTSSPEMRDIIVAEAMSAMSDWALEFLDRVYGLLRASGEREKTGKTTSGVASRHSSADVHAARNFSRVLKESLMQLFAAMSDDVHELAVRSVRRFLEDESLPAAAKDASFLCQAVAAARESSKKPGEVSSRGLESLLEVLTDDLAHHSTKTVVYRLRCLAGAVRQAGAGVVKHRQRIGAAIDFALKSQDRHIFKTGCKVLRHVLSTLSESYPLLSDSRPRAYTDGTTKFLGRSAQLHGDAVKWHVPDKECVTFIYELLQNHVIRRLDACSEDTGDGMGRRSRMLNSVDIQALRQCLRVVRYSIRGGASVLVDHVPGEPLQKEDDFVPYEMAGRRLLSLADEDSRNSILSLRMRISSFLVVLSAVVASDTLYPDAVQGLPESDPYRKMLPLISSDPKVCKETCLIALLLLTRRGASFRSQEARTIWKAQKQLATDFPLSAQVDQMAESLQCASLYGKGVSILYKDGENAGKTIPRRLLVGRIRLFHDSLQRNASFEVPRRLRRAASGDSSRQILFSVKGTLPEMLEYLETILPDSTPRPLDAYEGISDGLCALCCHSNTQVRASAIGVIDYAVTRFAWLLGPRVSRLMSAIELKDDGMNGKFGFPSCAMLVEKVNQQGKRKRLAEAIKGVCSILSLARSIKQLLVNERMRFRFAQTMCGTDGLIALLPAEEVQKVVHYLHAVFSPFRSKVYYLPRISKSDRESYIGTMSFGNDILAEKKSEANGDSESVAVHWRKLLLACWFLLTLVDGDDRDELLDKQYERTWDTCIRILETESGQPLQRVGLGLFGRLTFLAKDRGENIRQLREKMATESFCKVLADAIMFDHREDASIGGGHDAQWSAGVEDIIRDSSRNIAPRTLFPFQRTSQSLGSFKVSHSQLVECVLNSVDKETGRLACGFLLSTCREMAAAPPSEDQRNLQITSAEIFSGICGYLLRNSYGDCGEDWRNVLLPYLDEVMGKIPFSLSSAYFDALRYALQFSAPKSFYPLTEWLVDKVLSTLWQPQHGRDEDSEGHTSSGHGTEGFTAQSKWLYLISAVLIEIDDSEVDGSMSRTSWYESQLVENCSMEMDTPNRDLEVSWNMIVERLLPRLVSALGHPFDSCRDHISRCLFRICYCHRKRERIGHSRAPSRSNSMVSLEGLAKAEDDPGASVVEKLATLHQNEGLSFNDKYNALSTARRFMSYCVHLGEAKFEYSDYVIPLLPVAFEALKSTMEDEVSDAADTSEESAAKRALEAEVIKAYRYMIAEVSVTAVISYGRGVDIARVLDVMEASQHHEKWQVRHAVANFLRCFQGAHKFLFSDVHSDRTMNIVAGLLADERREVSSAAMAALTGILAASPAPDVGYFVKKYATLAGKSKVKRQKKSADSSKFMPVADANGTVLKKEERRAKNQQTSVFFLCAAVMSQPYDTPAFVPVALAAISKHSFERNAPLGVRDTVKKCCAEYKRTHMSDNWDLHRQKFTQEQLEALEDVVSSPHYYA